MFHSRRGLQRRRACRLLGRRCRLRRVAHRVAGFGRSFPELADASPNRGADVGKLGRSPDDQDEDENDDQLGEVSRKKVHSDLESSAAIQTRMGRLR